MRDYWQLAWHRFNIITGIISDTNARVVALIFYFTILVPFGLGSTLFADPLRRMGRVNRLQLPDTMGLHEAWLAEALAILEHGPAPSEPAPVLSGPSLEEYLRHIIAEPTDLHAIAAHFGGGGHINAAGGISSLGMKDTIEKIENLMNRSP